MERDEMRRHLGAGAASTDGRGGPAHEGDPMMALSVVSTDLGRLSAQVTELSEALAGLRQGQEEQQELAAQVSELAEQVTGIGESVQALGQKEAPDPPPQPWNWDAMTAEQEAKAILVLAEWVETTLAPWWPRSIGKEGLPPCWVRHPDMRRSMSLVMVSYQQAYEHEHRRVHHEVDFRRVLDDMLRDVRTAAEAYHCRTDDKKKRHIVDHQVRPERDRARAYLRDRALAWIAQADRDGDQQRVTELMEKYDVDPERLRAYMGKLFTRYLNQIADESIPGDSSPVVREAGRILAAYQVVDTNALEYAPGLETLFKELYRVDHERFAELRRAYEPLLRKYTVIAEYMGEMSGGQPTPQGKALMKEYGIVEDDVVRVRNMMVARRR